MMAFLAEDGQSRGGERSAHWWNVLETHGDE
jgi:hypothetical protein